MNFCLGWIVPLSYFHVPALDRRRTSEVVAAQDVTSSVGQSLSATIACDEPVELRACSSCCYSCCVSDRHRYL